MIKTIIATLLLIPSTGIDPPDRAAEATYRIWFAQSGAQVDPNFKDNRETMEGMATLLNSLSDQGVDTVYVGLHSFSSPEGTADLNRVLARIRGASVREWMTSLQGVPALTFRMEVSTPSWTEVAGEMISHFRRCDVMLSYTLPVQREVAPEPEPELEPVPEPVLQPLAQPELELQPDPIPQPEPWSTSWYLKTNFLTYPLNLTANLAVEVELGRYFSISVPFYYSAMNWFRSDIKFRVAGSQPEVRYWFRRDFTGFFAALHATFSWYNIALAGRYRYQDHSTTSPVFGGGVTGGYRLPLGRSRWALEFSLGLGYLPLYYDTFYNVENGALAEEGLWKHYWGPDHAAITLSYRFGKRREK